MKRSLTRRNKRKGVGTIIGGAIVAAILLTSVYVFFWTIMQNENLRGKTDAEIQKLDSEKSMEVISAVASEDPASGKIDVKVANSGPVPVRVSYMFVYDDNSIPLVPPSGQQDVTINAGQSEVFDTALVADGTNYRVDMITERGNMASALWPLENTTIPDPTNKVGVAISPDIYLILPGPFGDNCDNQINVDTLPKHVCMAGPPSQGLWGAVVVNPTNVNMNVSRIAITAYTAQHTSSTQVIFRDCEDFNEIAPVNPTTASQWSCQHDNQIQWRDLQKPVLIKPNEVKSFLATVQPGDLPSGQEEPASAVVATVYTDIGVFSKAGYSVAMAEDFQPIGNVYLTDTTVSSEALQNKHMLGHLNNIAPGQTVKLNVTFADLDKNGITTIKAGSRLIINVPPDFKDVDVPAWNSADFNQPIIQKRADGYTQIIASTNKNNPTGNLAGGEAKILSFIATAPTPIDSTIYIMTIFNEGTTSSSAPFSAGAFAETALQVDGTS